MKGKKAKKALKKAANFAKVARSFSCNVNDASKSLKNDKFSKTKDLKGIKAKKALEKVANLEFIRQRRPSTSP